MLKSSSSSDGNGQTFISTLSDSLSQVHQAIHPWCLDLVTNLQPMGDRGEIVLLVAVFGFRKWIVATLLESKYVLGVSKLFYNHILCQFGILSIIKMDQGSEFKGQFIYYLQVMVMQ